MARVLVVDDDAAALAVRKLVLERSGHTVATVVDARSARDAMRNTDFDVVITDLRLPEAKDGLALIRETREITDARIIVLCGDISDIEGREESAKVEAILQKPVRSEDLLSRL